MSWKDYLIILTKEERKIKKLWKDILKFLDTDLAYIWSDEVKRNFEQIKDEAEKVAFILKKIHSHYESDISRYHVEIFHIKLLISHLKTLKSDKRWIKKVHGDIVNVVKDIENEGRAITRRSFLKMAGKGAVAGFALSALKPFKALASGEDFSFRNEKLVGAGSILFSNLKEIIADIKRITIFVIRENILRLVILENENLMKFIDSTLVINGIIKHIEIYTTKQMQIAIDRVNYAGTISRNILFIPFKVMTYEGVKYYFEFEGGRVLIGNRIDEDFLERLWQDKKTFAYGIGGFGLDSVFFIPLNAEDNFLIKVDINNKVYCFKMVHQPSTQFKKSIGKKVNYNELQFIYTGNKLEEYNKIPNIDTKQKAIIEGVHNVEKFFNVNIVDICFIEDTPIQNAASLGTRSITFSTGELVISDENSIVITAEHEALHSLDMTFGISKNKEFFDYFFKLKYGRDSILLHFDFIREKYYFGNNAVGGHPYEHEAEFFASFVHTLLYLDILIKNLNKYDNRDIKLSILSNYNKVIELMMKISPNKIRNVFKRCLIEINKIKI